MKKAKTFLLALSALTLATAAAPRPQEPTSAPVNLVETAAKTEGLKTFSSLVEKAGLTENLKKPGPYTIFAPTDAAFEKIPKDLLDKVSADPETLKKILNYHVVAGSTTSADLKDGAEIKTVEEESIKVSVTPGTAATDSEPAKPPTVSINDKRATVVTADVKASNGVIHEIDNVLIPPSLAPAATPATPGKSR